MFVTEYKYLLTVLNWLREMRARILAYGSQVVREVRLVEAHRTYNRHEHFWADSPVEVGFRSIKSVLSSLQSDHCAMQKILMFLFVLSFALYFSGNFFLLMTSKSQNRLATFFFFPSLSLLTS